MLYTTSDTLTAATLDNVQVGTHVLVKVGSGTTLRPAIVEGFGTKAAYKGGHRYPSVKAVFSWANGRVTHGRPFGAPSEGDVSGMWLAPEPHSPATVEILTNAAVA